MANKGERTEDRTHMNTKKIRRLKSYLGIKQCFLVRGVASVEDYHPLLRRFTAQFPIPNSSSGGEVLR